MTVSAPTRITIERPQVSTKKPRGRAATIFAVLAWQVIGLLFVEGVLYWAGLGEEDIYKLDRTIGFRHFPNKRVTWRSEGYAVSNFDADGMREPGLTIEKPAGVYRIALLGDSMVEGLQVPIEQTFGKLVEKKLTSQLNRPVEVINFANSGYSTAQEYLLLKEKVFKYKPDLVVVGYMNRDMFENWTPPDQTLTNLRPYALQLPGQKLVVDSSSVTNWMKSPRAKFLVQMEWFRQNSRIWGLISSTTTQLSISDPFYRGLVAFFTCPAKTIREWANQAQHFSLSQVSWPDLTAPSFNIKFFETTKARREALAQSSITRAPSSVPKVEFVVAPQLHPKNTQSTTPAAGSVASATSGTSSISASGGTSPASVSGGTSSTTTSGVSSTVSASGGTSSTTASGGTSSASSSNAASGANFVGATNAAIGKGVADKGGSALDPSKAKNGNAVYLKLMSVTMQSLLVAMQAECRQHGSKFALVFIPSRAQLSPTPGMETSFFYITYKDEERLITEACHAEHIPVFDGEQAAEQSLTPTTRPDLFYLMHFNAKGHEFFAGQLFPFLSEQVSPSGSR